MTVQNRLPGLDGPSATCLLERQLGVLSRAQAISMGLTKGALAHRLRAGGPWQEILPRTYLTFTGDPSLDQKDIAAFLYAGPDSVVTGRAALRRLGIRCPETSRVDVLVGAACSRASRDYVVIHRTRRMPESTLLTRGVASTWPARAVVDAAAGLRSLSDVRAIVAGTVQQRGCTVADLQAELANGPRRHTALLRRVLAEVTAGVRSAPEGDLRDLIIVRRLPMPMFNPRLYLNGTFLACPDAWWPEAGVAAEADSAEWHFSLEDWRQTARRHDRMTAAGILVLHFTPREIVEEADRVAREIGAALRAGRPAERITTQPAAA